MRFEHIVLLIIAFNVVSAVLQRRARKARQEAEGEDAVESSPDAEGAEEYAPDAAEPSRTHRRRDRARREAAAREPAMSRDARADARHDARQAAGKTRAPESAPDDSAEEPMRMPSLGRDILDQIARDLGLKVPRPAPTPAPEPVSTPVPPPEVRRELPSRRPIPATARSEAKPAMPRDAAPRREFGRDFEGHARPQRSPVPVVRVAPPVDQTALATRPAPMLRAEQLDAARLREAFVLKEILEPPVARRPGGRGGLRQD